MKVLQVINSMATGGAEKLILDTLPLYRQKGIQMDLLVLDGGDYPFLRKLQDINCCTIHRLHSSSVYNPLNSFKIISYLKKYDLIHVHLFPALYWVALAKMLSFSKVKLVYTEHSTNNRRMNSALFRVLDKLIYSKYSKVICITEEVKSQIQKHVNLPNERLIFIQNGINLDAFSKAKPIDRKDIIPNLKTDSKLLIQVSSFQFPKDQLTLIRAMKNLPENFYLLLVGQGVQIQECMDEVSNLNLNDKVHFLGVRMDVLNLLQSVDVVILSSQYEGLSLSCIEGLASGKPFIGSDVPGIQDIIKGAGILFPKGDDNVLAQEILKVIEDQSHYSEVVQKCIERAKQYDVNLMIEKHIELYKKEYDSER